MNLFDLKNQKILSLLDMDARMPLGRVAKQVGLSRQGVEYRLKRLREEGIIFGPIAIFDSAAVGFQWYRVILRLFRVDAAAKNDFLHDLKSYKNIVWLGEIGGNWDIAFNLACKSISDFNVIFEELITKHGDKIMDYEIVTYVSVYDYSRDYLHTQKRMHFFHEMRYNEKIILDELDKKIIRIISKNASLTNVEVGNLLDVSRNTIKNRIDKMMQEKILLGFRLMVHPGKIGHQSHMLFLCTNKLNIRREKELYAFLQENPQVTFAVKQVGKWRIGMEVETKDEMEFQEFFIAIRGMFSDIITNYESFIIIKDHVINYFPDGLLE